MSNLRELGIQGTTDCHTHSGTLDYYNMFTKNIPYTQSVDDLMLKADLAGIDNVVTFPFPSSSYWNIKLLVEKGEWVSSGYGDFPYQTENDILLRACEVNGGSIFPFLCIDPKEKQQEQIDYLMNLWDQGKFFGIKHHSLATNTKVSELVQSGFGEFIAERNIPLIVHSSYLDPFSNPHFALDFAKEFPTVRMSIAHLGWLDESVLQKVRESENLFTDCSTILQITDFFKNGKFLLSTPNRLVSNNPAQSLNQYYQYLQDQLLWGTDEPWTTLVTPDGSYSGKHSYFEEVEVLLELAKITLDAVRKITVVNPQRFIFGSNR